MTDPHPADQKQQLQQQHQALQPAANEIPGGSMSFQSQSHSGTSSLPQELLDSYQPGNRSYDEVVDTSGTPRPSWQRLSLSLSQLGPAGIEHRCKQIRRVIHQHGIAYNAYGDPSLRPERRQLDPLPQLIEGSEWNRLEAALQQRADVLNQLLADLYGAQTLLRERLLPPSIVYQHPNFQQAFFDLPTAGNRHLHFYSAGLVRSPGGDWWISSDHTDCPVGSGFALENRIVISRSFPNEFRRCNVQRLAPYFAAVRKHLTTLAGNHRETPHIAILSAGGGSRTFFEDSFLARYLGFTLVEANDLVVRSRRVMLKTLSGLAPIDVILRRRSGNTIDPLELGGSKPGIPGILQVIREGNVAVVNGPETELVESPIFMAFLPRICQALTGQPLQLPGIATWWGGEPDSLELMLDRIDEINLVPAFRPSRSVSQRLTTDASGSGLESESATRHQRQLRLRNDPHAWVGQEKMQRSSAPIWEAEQLQSQYLSIRCFLAASGASWQSLPGGLAQMSDQATTASDTRLTMGRNKDVWVLANKPVGPEPLIQQDGDVVRTIRSNRFVPSRLADNLCWLGRSIARADCTARTLRSLVVRLTGEVDPAEAAELPVLAQALNIGLKPEQGERKSLKVDLQSLEQGLPESALDPQDPASLRSIVDQISALAGRVRERLSSDGWRIVQEIASELESHDSENCELSDLLDLTDTLIVYLASFGGMVHESMTRTFAYQFYKLGRHLEQGLQLVDLVKSSLATSNRISADLLEAVLEISDSGMTYRSRYYANLQLPAVLDLLLLDETNPRSLGFQLVRLNETIESLPGNQSSADFSQERRLAMDCLHSIRMADPTRLCKLDDRGRKTELLKLLEKMESQLPEMATSISNRFLVHSGPVHQLIGELRLPNSSGSV